jgi:hypothetical protein
MYKLLLCGFLFLASCTPSQKMISYTTATTPVYPLNPAPQKILLLNVYNVDEQKYRENKEAFFKTLIDDLLKYSADKIVQKTGIATEVVLGYTSTNGNKDSAVHSLLQQYKATHALVITSFDVYFNQTHVDVTRDNNNKKIREAFYDIVSKIGYLFYKADTLLNQTVEEESKFHSTRNVASGLLAAGPNIVVQHDDAIAIAHSNFQHYLNRFFPGEEFRQRVLFTGKGFEAVGAALAKNDYEAALIESMRLVKDPDTKKAAKANYNCAVLFERKNQPEEARNYLRQSLALAILPEAELMRSSLY